MKLDVVVRLSFFYSLSFFGEGVVLWPTVAYKHIIFIPSVNASLFPSYPVIAQQTHEQSDHGGRDGGYAWAQQYGLPFAKADLATATAESLIHQQLRLARRPKNGTPSLGDRLAIQWQANYTGTLSWWKGKCFVLDKQNTY